MQWNEIADANLVIAGKTIVVQPPSSSGSGAKASSSAQRYKVQPGDTLYSIAQQWGVSVESLSRRNGINNPRLLLPGTVLERPEPASAAPSPSIRPVVS